MNTSFAAVFDTIKQPGNFTVKVSACALLTKREVKMAEYWPNSLLYVFLE